MRLMLPDTVRWCSSIRSICIIRARDTADCKGVHDVVQWSYLAIVWRLHNPMGGLWLNRNKLQILSKGVELKRGLWAALLSSPPQTNGMNIRQRINLDRIIIAIYLGTSSSISAILAITEKNLIHWRYLDIMHPPSWINGWLQISENCNQFKLISNDFTAAEKEMMAKIRKMNNRCEMPLNPQRIIINHWWANWEEVELSLNLN